MTMLEETEKNKNCYLNIDAHPFLKVLVINASKEGLTVFLDLYSKLDIPPSIIPLQYLRSNQRRWSPKKIVLNPDVTPSDPTPYSIGECAAGARIQEYLQIRFLEESEETLIFCPGVTERQVTLTMNLLGWKQFLAILTYLRDRSTWFYVTHVQPGWKHLPFQLTPPDAACSDDVLFYAMECVRLEPVDEIYLIVQINSENSYVGVRGNPSGLLWLTKQIDEFIASTNEDMCIHNIWTRFPFGDRKASPEHFIHLQKVNFLESDKILSFEYREGVLDRLYIFGNKVGLQGLSEELWNYAFEEDHEVFHRRSSFCAGDLVNTTFGSQDFHSARGWELMGGMYLTEKYDPLSEIAFKTKIPREELLKKKEPLLNFVNQKVVLS